MSNVLDFQKFKIEKNIDNTTESTDARGVCYLSVIKSLVQVMAYFQQKYGYLFIFTGTKIVPYSKVQPSPQNFFVRLPEMVSHGIRVQGVLNNPYMEKFKDGECSKSKFRAELLFNVLKEYKEGVFNSTLDNILRMYCFEYQLEEASNQIVCSFKGQKESQNMTLIFNWEESDKPCVTFDIEFKMWVAVTSNEFENQDHIYAMDVVNYSNLLMLQYVPGTTCF